MTCVCKVETLEINGSFLNHLTPGKSGYQFPFWNSDVKLYLHQLNIINLELWHPRDDNVKRGADSWTLVPYNGPKKRSISARLHGPHLNTLCQGNNALKYPFGHYYSRITIYYPIFLCDSRINSMTGHCMGPNAHFFGFELRFIELSEEPFSPL